jgi:hypothetical protein
MFNRSAASFDNADHVSIVIHNYRWRLGLAAGEARYDDLERRLAGSPDITVPTITLEGDANGGTPSGGGRLSGQALGQVPHRSIPGGAGTICRTRLRGLSPKPSPT